ncbi:fibrobacter succinogenes major paralogous domain-containing protein [bacterium]|nr:fibrobacter succinogenes major paralogous domain-containing protein [bacterium]
MTYQGKLTDTLGVGIIDTFDIEFSIWNAESGGDSLWGETQPNVPIIKGHFDVQLGYLIPITLSFDTTYYLQIIVDGDLLLPRTLLTTSPYSFHAFIADSFAGGVPGAVEAILDQHDSAQIADGWINGQFEAGRVIITPNTRDSSFTPKTGMMRTIGSGGDFQVAVYDGDCWRKCFPIIDTITCFGTELTLDAGNDTTICIGCTLMLSAIASGGWPPYLYDWNIDGLGDWDDSTDISHDIAFGDTLICLVQDAMDIVGDTVIVSCNCGTCVDIDGNTYETIWIGSQCWMAENLKVTHYRDSTPIPNVTDGGTWSGLTTGAYCEYDNDTSNVPTYGRLYDWYAVDDPRGLAPAGWHVPTDAEWQTLVD